MAIVETLFTQFPRPALIFADPSADKERSAEVLMLPALPDGGDVPVRLMLLECVRYILFFQRDWIRMHPQAAALGRFAMDCRERFGLENPAALQLLAHLLAWQLMCDALADRPADLAAEQAEIIRHTGPPCADPELQRAFALMLETIRKTTTERSSDKEFTTPDRIETKTLKKGGASSAG